MRKIILQTHINPADFLPVVTMKQKNDDGSVTELYSAVLQRVPESKYTKEQLEKIDNCNTILKEKGMELLSEEEIDYMLDPEGFNKRLTNLEEEMSNTENLQRLAGFKVEKKIISLD